MESLEQKMVSYGAYHKNAKNKMLHWLGIPAVTFAIFIPMGWVRVTLPDGFLSISLATLFYIGILAYYFRLDWQIACGVLLGFTPILLLSDQVAQLPLGHSAAVFGGAFIVGWMIQLTGHYFEGRKPALTDNFSQVFNAPIFLITELAIALGMRSDLRRAIEGERV